MQAEPRVSSAQTSQTPYGHMLLVLDAEGDWMRVRSVRDGYEGWTHAGYLDVLEPPDLDALVASDPDAFGPYVARSWRAAASPRGRDGADMLTEALGSQDRVPRYSFGCEIERRDGRRLRLPAGAIVHVGTSVTGGDAVPIGDPMRLPYDARAVVATARALFDSVSYQWGGVTPWGADCSGFIQTVVALHGLDLPRDASQQARVGVDAGRDFGAHVAGDLLFFSDREDGQVTHVGLAAGDGRMLHVALGRGGYADEDLAAGDDAYVATLRARFVGARRVLG